MHHASPDISLILDAKMILLVTIFFTAIKHFNFIVWMRSLKVINLFNKVKKLST